jgi:hypothetical protein
LSIRPTRPWRRYLLLRRARAPAVLSKANGSSVLQCIAHWCAAPYWHGRGAHQAPGCILGEVRCHQPHE